MIGTTATVDGNKKKYRITKKKLDKCGFKI